MVKNFDKVILPSGQTGEVVSLDRFRFLTGNRGAMIPRGKVCVALDDGCGFSFCEADSLASENKPSQ